MSIEQLRQLFALESQDTLQQIEDSLLQLETSPDDSESIKLLFRAFHTIKGSAGVVGLDEISEFTHVIENLLDKVRNGKMGVTPDFIRLLLRCRDFLEKSMDHLGEGTEADPDLARTKQELQSLLHDYQQSPPAPVAHEPEPPLVVVPETPPTPEPPSAAPVPPPEPVLASPGALPPRIPPEAKIPPAENAEMPVPPSAKPAFAMPSSGVRPDRLFQVFMDESRDTLTRMRAASEGLLAGQAPDKDYATLQSATRTLQGAANLVSLKSIAQFSRQLVAELERGNGQSLVGDADFAQLLQDFTAHISDLLDHAYRHPPSDPGFDQMPPELQSNGDLLLQQLRAAMDATLSRQPAPREEAPMPTQHTTPVEVLNEQVVEDGNWHISLRFTPEALRAGVDPLATIHYLQEQGEIVSLRTLSDLIPSAEAMDPEVCYLGFEIAFKSEADREGIESLFELVRDYCEVRIVPPHSEVSRYIELIQELPEDTRRLGEILIESGTLTERELNEGLGEPAMASAPIPEEPISVTPRPQPDAAQAPKSTAVEPRPLARKMLHVDAKKLDQLIDLVGELVIANAGINLLAQESNDGKLKESASLMSRLVEDIRNSTLSMRMVQIGNTFNRFRRLVHDLSHDLGKQIQLEINGSETELDKSMVEKINDPLMHLVRNAMDHGIEPEAERQAIGKPAEGTVQLNAYHDSGSIVIEVCDDGRGLDRDAILASAIERGLIKPDQELSEQEIDNLIFEPSLSTAKTVTQLSGRGVGLDVVKRNINALNGAIDVKSRLGEGTLIQIYLPLTLAIIDGFLLSVGDSAFVVPLDRVVECVELTADIQEHEAQGYINLRGKVLPLLYLNQLFNLRAEDPTRRQNIIVVHYGNQQAGLVVDELLGELQAVIKPLGRIFEKLSGVSGATILGSGEVALILDVPELAKRYAGKHHPQATPLLPAEA